MEVIGSSRAMKYGKMPVLRFQVVGAILPLALSKNYQQAKQIAIATGEDAVYNGEMEQYFAPFLLPFLETFFL